MSKVNEAAQAKRVSANTLARKKANGEKFATLTAYDASFAALFDQEGIDMLLVGDSLGNVIQGQNDTLAVTVDDIAYHTRCVSRVTERALIVADMPFMSYSTPEQACLHAATLMRAGAQMVKLEGGAWLADTIRTLVERSVPVCAHLGLMPQSVHLVGGYKVQGRDPQSAERIIADAQALETAGAQLLVVECVTRALAKRLSSAVNIPVIGIGAGADTDGQVLVMHDLLGISTGHIPKFAKNYLTAGRDIRQAVRSYVSEVVAGQFPAQEHGFE